MESNILSVRESEISAMEARHSAMEARHSAMEARQAALVARESTGNSEEIIITWNIDRTPDYTIYENIEREYMENILNHLNYNTNIDIQPTIPFNQHVYHDISLLYNVVEISEEMRECCICMEQKTKDDICVLGCHHSFCNGCTESIIKKPVAPCCPLCRADITFIYTQKNEIQERLQNYCL
jgi:hypothetical protein